MTSISNFNMQAPAFAGVIGKPNLSIASESPADSWARERLLDEAFGAARSGKTAERLREGRLPAPGLALAATDAGDLVGTLRMWHVLAGEVPALLLGPLAVVKAYRSRGIGRRLMAEALLRAASAGHKAVLLVGDAA
jgi:predicted N-acetyltransferase YhbS